MNHSMINASVSLQGLQKKLDILANNIANIDTVGYKKQEVSFEDLLNNRMQQADHFNQPGRLTPLGLTQGYGSRVAQVLTNMEQGSLQATDNTTDIALDGDGLFEVITNRTDATGVPIRAWTRDGAFSLSVHPADPGRLALTTKDGYFVSGLDVNPITVPVDHRMSIDVEGRIIAYSESNPNAAPEAVGQLKLMHAIRPQMLQQSSGNLFVLPAGTNQNGEILRLANTAQDTAKIGVRQGFLEKSNVQLDEEITQMMVVQRAFQLNSRAITSSDTMTGLANNLRG